MAIVPSTLRMLDRTGCATDAGGTLVRTTSETCCERSRNGKNRSGSAVGVSGRPRDFVSATTPTIDSQGFADVSDPILMRLPTGSWPGQKRVTTRSLTITAGEAGVISDSRNV